MHRKGPRQGMQGQEEDASPVHGAHEEEEEGNEEDDPDPTPYEEEEGHEGWQDADGGSGGGRDDVIGVMQLRRRGASERWPAM